jgi:CheY-like chemotaxis protein
VFVDDEPRILDAVGRFLQVSGAPWSARFFTTAAEALESLSREPADLVMSDLCMSGLDGADLLQIVARQSPQTARVIFSSEADLESSRRAADVAHQFIAKPATPTELARVIHRIAGIYASMPEQTVRAAIVGANVLPVSPQVARALRALHEKSGVTAKRLANCIEQDAALTAKVLQFANSAFFASAAETISVRAAVDNLGVDIVREFVSSLEVADAVSRSMNSMRLQDAQSYAIIGARIAQRTAPVLVADEAYLVTLLRGLGELLFPRLSPDAWPMLSAQLVGLWGLPRSIVSAVGGAVGEAKGSPAWELARYAAAANRLAHGELPMTEITQRFAFTADQRAGNGMISV